MSNRNQNIPLVRAAFKAPFEAAMQANNLDASEYFQKVGLPVPAGEDKPDSLIPEKPFWELINLVASREQIPDFGIQVAQLTPWHRVASLAPLIHSSANLLELLDTFCKIASKQSNTSKFELIHKESHSSFISRTETLFPSDRQMELYRVTSMIQLVQLAAGSGWTPDRVDFQMTRFRPFPSHPLYGKAKLRYAQANSRVVIPSVLLRLPVHLEIVETAAGSQAVFDIKQDFGETVRQLILVYAASGCCKIDNIANLCEVSVRSLQRRLKARGLSFKQLHNEVKLELAKQRLRDPEIAVTHIATELGYTDTAHFSRAFRRGAGVSPSQYRRSLIKGGQI